MAKISYSEHVKKNDISVILAEILFQHLKKEYSTVSLSKVINSSSGGTPNRAIPHYYGGEIPWLKSGELNDAIITTAEEFITTEGLNNSSAKIFKKGTLLVAMYGATAGKTGVLGIDAASNQAVCAITPKDSTINADFLFWFFRAHRFYFIDISRGGAQPNISQGVINKTLFPIIPTEIQEKIATFLSLVEQTKEVNYSLIPNELHQDIKLTFNYLHSLEALSTEITTQQTYLTQLRQAILQEAIEGKLTADWRVKNPVQKGDPNTDAVALLENIKAEKQRLIAEGKIKKDKPLAPINPDDVPFELPAGWVWVRLGEIAKELSTGPFGSMLHKSDYVTDGTPLINPTNIVNGRIVEDKKITISDSMKIKLEKYVLNTGDLVIARRGDLSKCAIVQEFQNGWICGTGSFFMRILGINKNFFQLNYKSSSSQKYLLKDSIGQTMDNLNQSLLSKLPIPLPPLAEQQAIVERVERLLNHINALEQQVTERKSYAEQLMQAVLKEAFEK